MENVCRTCMRTAKKLTDLERDDSLLEKILVLSSIQITFDDEALPKSICNECEDNLNKFFCFRKVIINSDKELKERLSSCDTLRQVKEEIICNEIFFDENENNKNGDEYKEDCDDPNSSDDSSYAPDKKKKTSKYTKPRSKTCTECNITFQTGFELRQHKKKNHIKPGVCNICGAVVRADNLSKHVKMHFQETVSCKICNKKYKNSESLRCHLQMHKGVEFKCDICGKVSNIKSEHTRHIKSHKDPNLRKVVCAICGKRMKHLKRHMQIHTGERPHPCQHCGKCFTSSYALKVHTRQHTNEKPFICEYCSMGFTQKCSLMTHLSSKHNIKSK